jgi:hypothetical protein
MLKHPRTLLALAAILALPSGCGDEGGSAAAPGPTDHEVFLVQRAASAAGSIGQTTEAASDAIVFSAPGTSSPGPMAVPIYPGATPAFDYGADVDFVLDFDALDPDGNDLFPNSTGQVHITAVGTDSDTPDAGEATYSAAIATDSVVTFTDPGTGTVTTIPAGASWSYLLTVTWSRSDDRNWTVTATTLTTIDFTGLVVDDGISTLNVDIVGEREVVSTRTRDGGKLTHERTFQGSLTITADDGTTVETVTIDYLKPGHVRITAAGNVFGPMDEARTRALFHAFIP